MKHILLSALLGMSTICYAQKKDCDLEALPNAKGGKNTFAITKTSIGKFMVGKEDGKIGIGYVPKTLFAAMPGGATVALKLDSATFVFEDMTTLKVAAQGLGHALNVQSIKPQFKSVYVGIFITDEMVSLFKTKLVTAMHVTGEKDSEGGDFLNEKNRLQFQKSFTCIESN